MDVDVDVLLTEIYVSLYYQYSKYLDDRSGVFHFGHVGVVSHLSFPR